MSSLLSLLAKLHSVTMELPRQAHGTFPYSMCFPLAHPSTKPAPWVSREAGNHSISDPDPPLAPASLPAAGQPRAQQVAVTLRLHRQEEGGAPMGGAAQGHPCRIHWPVFLHSGVPSLNSLALP